MYMTASPNGGNRRRCGFPGAIHAPSCCLWLLSDICSEAVQRTQLHGSSLCGSTAVSLGDAPDTHGPRFSPCSERPRSLVDRCMLLRFRNATFSEDHTIWLSCFSHCELCVASMIRSQSIHLMCTEICTCHFVASLPQCPSPRTPLNLFVRQLLLSPIGLRRISEPTQEDNVRSSHHLRPHLP